ncbi:MAG: hypothetical protein RMX96_13010 [Nostoc sp. ChiSLP02]|nr:hypothetical protein [Nostoc sp. DedSLP05]MDZ8098287.1 hypothetical protein [Nostoc sp. DedSLP01]MDZ8185761.1 hypothetical protein [Nostoc sp. ChiSLP02]
MFDEFTPGCTSLNVSSTVRKAPLDMVQHSRFILHNGQQQELTEAERDGNLLSSDNCDIGCNCCLSGW